MEPPAPQPVINLPAFNIPFPPKLDLKSNLTQSWKRFKRVWDNYEIATGLSTKDKSLRTATFLTCIGADALEIFEGFEFETEDQAKDINLVIQKFDTFCVGKTNETYERYCFNKRDQEQSENIDTYVSILRTLAKTCNYGALEDDLIRDRMVIGIRDNNTRKKLLQDAKLKLNTCIDVCRASEKTSKQLREITQEEVHVVRKHQTKGQRQNEKSFSKSKSKIECKFCGRIHAHKKEACPAWGQTCHKCGRDNHFEIKCQGRAQQKPQQKHVHKQKLTKKVHYVDEDDYDDEFVLTIRHVNAINDYSKRIQAKMFIQDQDVLFQVDCGSTVNILPEKMYMKIFRDNELRDLEDTTIRLVMFNKTETKPLGKRRVRVVNPATGKRNSVEFVIVRGNVQAILGAQASQQMGLITVNKNVCIQTEGLERVQAVKTDDQDLTLKYNSVFEGLGKLPGKLQLEVDRTVQPVQIPTRKVPVAVREKLKDELDRLSKLEIITPVKSPTEWISSMVVVTKPSGKVRLCIDPKPLNKALKRNHYPTPTVDAILPELHKARIFTVADAKDGFWQVELDEESSYLTTFGTPWGRYRWRRMPFGISPAPEEFQRRVDEALEGLEGTMAIHDDILVYGCGETDEEALIDHDKKLQALFDRCQKKNLKINKEKLKLRLKSVTYLGHVISAEGLKVDPAKIKAIVDMPTPTDKAAIQRLLGMVNYVQKFAPNISQVTTILRNLLKNENEFCWEDSIHGECFEKIKTMLSDTPVLRYFDPGKPITLQCDASEAGLGACLMQDDHPVAYASRALTTTERNYAQIEKELLAVVFGLERFETYVYGKKVLVESDHKPLEIICKKSLASAPKRLQRMLLRLQRFEYEVVYKRGVEMYMADTLSRAYLPYQSEEKQNNEHVFTLDEEEINMLQHLPISEKRLSALQQATECDQDLCLLKSVIRRGWPDSKEQLPKAMHIYFPYREEMTIQNGLVLKNDRVVVPLSQRHDTIVRLHSGHVGLQSTLRRARESVYWPNMFKDLEEFTNACDTCNTFGSKQHREPMISHEVPARPWQKLGCDLFELNQKSYLITVDYYSDFFEVDRLTTKTGKDVINKLKAHIARQGIPDILVTDNGPPFNSREFENFTEKYDIEHVTSSPGYPQSNGKSENAVKTAKRLLGKSLHDSTDPYIALLEWRNTTTEGIGSSPAQRLLGRRAKTLLPMLSRKLEPQIVKNTREKLMERKAKETFHYDRKSRRTDLNSLKRGDTVRIRPLRNGHTNGWTKATVEGQVDIRSYKVRTEDGRSYRRNRLDLKPTKERMVVERDDVEVTPSDVRQNDVEINYSSSNHVDTPPEVYTPVSSQLDASSVSQQALLSKQRSPTSVNQEPAAVTPVKMTTRGRSVLPKRFKDYQM
ncbi:uncharacterized protein K02A2.6-like [Ylistrum balloti]|uniref:uncharacterized protein K02A2.6-like n=1 Tax=Ylistrum balloti TaxID=509963 RepID=UPI0029058E57|nr:uncharacterized protein K02A2.6-like [Ylistrum balloti]